MADDDDDDNGQQTADEELPTIDEDAELNTTPDSSTPKRHLERRILRRLVWGSAVSAINLGGALAQLGVPNAHHGVLRRLMQVAGHLGKQVPNSVVTTAKQQIGGVNCRVYRPATEQGSIGKWPVVIYLHGGGWSIGSARIYHPFTQRLCRDTGDVIVSVDYRLAPENAYPAPLDDCLAVVRAVLNDGALADQQVDADRVVLAGDSAGGNLSGAVALELIRTGGCSRRLRGVVMICPVTQAVTAMHESCLKYGPRYSSGSLGYFVSLYAGVAPTKDVLDAIKNDRHLPTEQRRRWLRYVMPSIAETTDEAADEASPPADISKVAELATTVRAWPLLAEDEHLAQMPSTMVQTCSHDVLRSENLVFIERLRKSGAADVRHSHMERSEHCETINSLLIGSKASRQGYLDIVNFLKQLLHVDDDDAADPMPGDTSSAT